MTYLELLATVYVASQTAYLAFALVRDIQRMNYHNDLEDLKKQFRTDTDTLQDNLRHARVISKHFEDALIKRTRKNPTKDKK